jgi:hypothetical protein
LFRLLILIWSLACVSGLGIFLFQIFGPSLVPQTGYDGRGITLAIAFFAFLWIVPVGVIAAVGRRQRN